MGLALRVNQSAPSATEQSLVAAVRSGNDAAFEELFSRYRDRIRAYAHGAVGDHARAEDITQDVFISALRRMRETERPISFKPWIYEIARNACIDEFRRSRRATEVSLDEDSESPGVELQLASPDPTPDVVAESRQKISNLRGAFGGLSENHHRILVMRELEGLSYGEIGRRLGMSRAMVESTLFRARKRLNQEFRELESGQRCQQVRSAIDRSELGSAEKILGIRERRQVARHMAYCQQCRQHAWMAGFDASSLKRRSIGQKIAALLPIGWWHAHGGGAKHAFRGSSSMTAAKATARLARYSEPLSQVGLGRAVTAAAALAVAAAGGGYVVAGSSPHHPAVAAPAAVTLQPPPARATAVFLRAGRTVAGTAAASSTAATTSSHRPGHKRSGAGARHHQNAPSGGHPGGGHAAPAPGSSGGGGGSSAGHITSTQPRSSGGGRGLLSSLLGGGGSSSSRTRLPALPSAPSTPSASIQAPSSLRAPAQTAVNAVTQAANAASQVVNSAEQTVNSIGNTASNVVGGATNLGGSGTGR